MSFAFKFYQAVVSPLLHAFSKMMSGNPYSGCRFEPTCSCYCEQAVRRYGFFKGTLKGIVRISKCHPFSRSGGYDPV